LVTTGNDSVIAQIIHQLGKLVDVVRVEDLTQGIHHERELLLLKLRAPTSQLTALNAAVASAGARVLADAPEAFVVELTSSEALVTRFITAASQYGEVLEVVRSGSLGIGSR
jgi:acetolactate synthase-1/3 small subunit